MFQVDIRWRPSGGRGEYEHVPQDILLGRRVVVNALTVPGTYLSTDAWGRIKDGKPRLRRENPNNRSILNVPQLIAALALLPDPIREDKEKKVVLPLQEKRYVVSSVSFDVDHADDNRAICTPQRLRVLHDNNEIDLVERMTRIASFLKRKDLPAAARDLADQYRAIVTSGIPSSELRPVADGLIGWLKKHPGLNEMLEAPSDKYVTKVEAPQKVAIDLAALTANETKKRLVSHYTIDRSPKIRAAKVGLFQEANDGNIFCENCNFSFEERYGTRGKGYIEVHHILALAALLPNTITNLADLMLLCSNCHRMVHRKQPILTPEQLKATTNGLVVQA